MRDNPAKAGGSRDIGSKENTKKYFEKENSCLAAPLNLKFRFLMQTDPRSQLIYKFMLTIRDALLMSGKESVSSSNSYSLASGRKRNAVPRLKKRERAPSYCVPEI